jgi:hypothetical protein
MKSSIFWDITPCSPLKVNWRFGGTCRLHPQGRIISRALSANCFHAGFLLGLFFDPENRGNMVPPNRRLTDTGLHGVISQKVELIMIMNDELEETCKESVVVCFKGLFKLLLKVSYIVLGYYRCCLAVQITLGRWSWISKDVVEIVLGLFQCTFLEFARKRYNLG